MITINSDLMKQELSREELVQHLAVLRAERDMFERIARRNLELAARFSELHLKSVMRELRGGR